MKFAYFALPHAGGTYSVFRELRAGLAPHGVEVRWLGLGPSEADRDPAWTEAFAFGTLVDARGGLGPAGQAAALAAELERGGYDGVFVNVLADQVQMNLVRYLPPRLLRVMIVHTITPATYAAARSLRDHVHATVAVSERCRADLVGRHGFPPHRIRIIQNAVAAGRQAARRPPPSSGPARLLFLGRIEDASKGVFWLPPLVSALGAGVRLTVAGDGPDLPALRRRMAPGMGRVAFLGAAAAGEVPALFASHDIFLMPSRFEGYPMSLIEAMAGGCVPVASRIRGVTDTIVGHGLDGLLFPVGDWRAAAAHVRALLTDPGRLRAMSERAAAKAAASFGAGDMAAAYMEVLRAVAADPPPLAAPLDLSGWALPRAFRAGLRTRLPPPVKNWLRLWRERIGAGAGYP